MPKNNRCGQATILSDSDFFKIRNALNPKYQMLYDIAWWTGERLGAIVQLSTAAVFDANGKPLPQITYAAKTRKGSSRGKRTTRQVPIHQTLKQLLVNYWKLYQPDYNGYLFSGPSGEHLEFQSADEALRRAVVKAGLQFAGISTHSYRRSFITRLANKGIAIATIQKLTGHSDLKVLSRYIEVSENQLIGAINNL